MQGYIRNYKSRFKIYAKGDKFYCYDGLNRKSALYDSIEELKYVIDYGTIEYVTEAERRSIINLI